MDKHEKNTILTIRDDELKEQHHKVSGRKNTSSIIGIRMEKKTPTSATNELGKHPSKKVKTELLEKTNNETNKLVVGLWKTSQNYEVKFCH